MTYHSDYDVYGFRRNEILSILEKHGIALGVEGSARLTDAPADPAQPLKWKQVLARRKRLSIFEAVCSMGGVDPFTQAETVERYGTNEAAYDMNKALLDEAIDDGIISCQEKSNGNYTQSFIEAKDFSAWCDANNIPRPLPWNFDATPTTDKALQEALEAANQRVEDLERVVHSLREELSHQGSGRDFSMILDPTNEFSPVELRAALEAWRSVVAKGNPRSRGAGVRSELLLWLENNREKYGLGKDAAKRIATVANWHKTGGLPKTPSRTPPSL